MVMYKQNRGFEAKGTIGPQSTGGIMSSQKKPQYSVQSMGDLSGLRNIPFLSNISDTAQRFTDPYGYRASQAAKNQEAQQLRSTFQSAAQQSVKAPPMPSAPLMAPKAAQRKLTQQEMNELSSAFQKATGRAFSTSEEAAGWAAPDEHYVNLHNQYVPRAPQSSPVRPAPRAGATYFLPTPVSQEPPVTAEYRPPLRSAVVDIQNPFTPGMQALMEAKAIEQAEQQAAITAQRLNAQLAGTGLMSGGPSGLSASMARQVASATEANRLNALREIGLQVPQMRAEFDMRKAGMIDPYNRDMFTVASQLARQPGELKSQELQNSRQEIENELAKINLTVSSDPSVVRAKIQEFADNARKLGNEIKAQEYLLIMSDPNAWWNNEIYKTAKEAGLSFIGGASQGVGQAAAKGGVNWNIGGGGNK